MEAGTVLGGRYELEGLIGQGGMANVWVATDQKLNRRVAVKTMLPEFALDAKFVRRFKREAQAAAQLQSPYIVAVHDVGIDDMDGTCYIVMELLSGQTLSQLLDERGPLSCAESAAIALQVAQALRVAHGHGIIHRDIKPQNVMLVEDGTVKVTDFGIALVGDFTRLTTTRSLVGTATYASPEQASGQRQTPASDIYSLGVTLYEMASCHVPYEGNDVLQVIQQILTTEPPELSELNPDVDEAYAAIVKRCMRRRPEDRYQTADEVYQALLGYLAEYGPTQQAVERLAADTTGAIFGKHMRRPEAPAADDPSDDGVATSRTGRQFVSSDDTGQMSQSVVQFDSSEAAGLPDDTNRMASELLRKGAQADEETVEDVERAAAALVADTVGAVEPVPAIAAATSGVRTCRYCDSKIPDGAAFCVNCGMPLGDMVPAASGDAGSPKTPEPAPAPSNPVPPHFAARRAGATPPEPGAFSVEVSPEVEAKRAAEAAQAAEATEDPKATRLVRVDGAMFDELADAAADEAPTSSHKPLYGYDPSIYRDAPVASGPAGAQAAPQGAYAPANAETVFEGTGRVGGSYGTGAFEARSRTNWQQSYEQRSAATTQALEVKRRNRRRRTIVIAALAAVVVILAAAVACKAGILPKLGGASIDVEVRDSVEDYSWDELSQIADAIAKADSDEDGLDIAIDYHLATDEGTLDGTQTKTVELSDGTEVEVMVVGFRQDDATDGGVAGITFAFKNTIAVQRMNASDSSEGGWEASELRSWLAADGMDLLPDDLADVITSVEKSSNNEGGSSDDESSVTTTSDELWLFSYAELVGEQGDSAARDAEGGQYQLFADAGVSLTDDNALLKRPTSGEMLYDWWLRTPYAYDGADGFDVVYSGGYVGQLIAGRASDGTAVGVAPGFCL